MIKIERYGNGFKVTAKEQGMGRGFTARARTVNEVIHAVEHYYDAAQGA